MTKHFRVVIADDDETVRTQIRNLLEGQMNMNVVAEAATGRDAIALVKEHLPGILLLDITMPGMNGLQALKRIRHDHPQTKVVIVSQLSDQESVEEAQELGAHGYIAKRDLAEELNLAMKTVMGGHRFLSRTVSQERPVPTKTSKGTRATQKPDEGMTNSRDFDTGDKHTSGGSCEQTKAPCLETGLIRVLVVDDDPLVVQTLCEMMAKDSQIQLVGSDEDVCKDVETAAELIRQQAPHVVLLDLQLLNRGRVHGRGGWGVVKRRSEQYSQVRVILCTVETDQSVISESWREGIEGYVPKTRLRELSQAIRTVHSGETYFSPSPGERVWRPSKETMKLSSKEREVFYLFVRDYSTKEIADQLCRDDNTVFTHIGKIRRKIGHQDGWEHFADAAPEEEEAHKSSTVLSELTKGERKVLNQYVGKWDEKRKCYVDSKTHPETIAEALSIPVGEVKALMLEIRQKLNCHRDGWKGIARDEGDI